MIDMTYAKRILAEPLNLYDQDTLRALALEMYAELERLYAAKEATHVHDDTR